MVTTHGRLRFQRVRTAHRSVPLVHDLLTNVADSIVVCTGSKAGNGNIVDRAALRALKFIYGTLPRSRHPREHAPTANPCKTEYCAVSLLVDRDRVWLEIKWRSAVVSFLGTHALPQDTDVFRTLVGHNRVQVGDLGQFPCAGVYAVVAAAGNSTDW